MSLPDKSALGSAARLGRAVAWGVIIALVLLVFVIGPFGVTVDVLQVMVAPFALLHTLRFLGLIPAAVFAIAGWISRSRQTELSWHTVVLRTVAVLWVAFVLIEFTLNKPDFENPNDPSVVVAVFILGPVYWVITIVGVVAAIMRPRQGATDEERGQPPPDGSQ